MARIKVPRSILVNTGDQNPVYKTIDDFFDTIIRKLEPKPLKRPTEFERKYYSMQEPLNLSRVCDTSTEFCHALFYKQRVIAAVTETRNDLNYIQFDFFYNPR